MRSFVSTELFIVIAKWQLGLEHREVTEERLQAFLTDYSTRGILNQAHSSSEEIFNQIKYDMSIYGPEARVDDLWQQWQQMPYHS